VIQVYEFGEQDGRYFIAMEYVQGQNLLNVMARLAQTSQRMPVQVAADITRQVCRGLAYAHELPSVEGRPLGVIHRDVSPVNVMVSYTGSVKVLDFGIARVTDTFRHANSDPGQVKGKSAYLAPEQLAGAPLDHRVDIFATGILLHEMLTGRRLFKGANVAETVDRLGKLRIPGVREVNPAVPERLEEIAMRALKRRPSERYQSAGEMADHLESFLVSQHFSSQELPQFMRAHFAEERARDQVYFGREQLRAIMESTRGEPASAPTSASQESLPPVAPSAALSGTDVIPRWRRSRARLLAIGAVVGAAALGSVLFLAFPDPVERTAAPTAAPAAPPVVRTQAPRPPQPTPPRAEAPRAPPSTPPRAEAPRDPQREARTPVLPEAPPAAPIPPPSTSGTPVQAPPKAGDPGAKSRERRRPPSRRSKADLVKFGIVVDPFAP
jgi:serine/threonine-protein kinase